MPCSCRPRPTWPSGCSSRSRSSIFTRVPETEHAPPAVITAVVIPFVLNATVNDDANAAVAGAPVNVAVGAACVMMKVRATYVMV